jgi:hypothetical protein
VVYDGSDGSAPVDRARIEALVGVATMAAE